MALIFSIFVCDSEFRPSSHHPTLFGCGQLQFTLSFSLVVGSRYATPSSVSCRFKILSKTGLLLVTTKFGIIL
jgi:hypothetical protein